MTVTIVLAVIGLAVAVRVAWRRWGPRPSTVSQCPDYAQIARLELGIYGTTFSSAGAPRLARQVPSLWVGYCRCAELRTLSKGPPLFCMACKERRHAERNLPDTTRPATVEEYATWLLGYVTRGGKPTHFYDYPYSRAGFRYAEHPLTIDSDYEYGANSRKIIVASGVPADRTDPRGGFGGWAHTDLFYEHGYRTNRGFVPVYSDPEFAEFARYRDTAT